MNVKSLSKLLFFLHTSLRGTAQVFRKAKPNQCESVLSVSAPLTAVI